MLRPDSVCQIKGALRNCGDAATAQCVYCARAFCAKHGHVMADGFEVCARKVCVAKKLDLEVHLVYKSAVLNRNGERLCGIVACETTVQVQCNRCRGYFCVTHTRAWLETVTEKPERTCSHCLKRQPVWDKE